MARHSSVSRVDRNKARLAASLECKLKNECPAVKSDRWQTLDKLEARATAHFRLVAVLQARNDPTARRKLRELRDVKYDTDPDPTCKGAWDKDVAKGKATSGRQAIGRDGKHQRIMKGQSARNSQAKGL